MTRPEPQRSCIGCRATRAQSQLLRLRRSSSGAVLPANLRRPAEGSTLAGRSAYLCPRRSCLERASKRRAFARAFGGRTRNVRVQLPADLLADCAEQLATEIDRLGKTTADPSTHSRRRRLEELLSELSSPPLAPCRGRADTDEHRRKGGPTHG